MGIQNEDEIVRRLRRIKIVAAACHEQNRTYCESIGDFAQVSWHDAPDWQRAAAVSGVEHALLPDASPADSHESWMRQKKEDGWTYGAVKDADIKTHPCLVPFDDLPEAQQRKDVLLLRLARSVGRVAGLIGS